ncbi:hypothetical protein LVB77_10925 [Lysobacter sp. 5GHs7-4]|uniref:hypothetical protein n=1 Tax=Lysobacter sp. 5GHs7-4 TaxID=2904253 RepID=UPI001E577558|nr:hypothetical protein [Lysobacter sp. 5GHs7-4]UHQ21214.1 hypothetical protein LVB77_10925 [Lysobacter sp. 5GHs7-4]
MRARIAWGGRLDINTDAIISALALLGGAIAWLHQLRTKSRRDKIKLDLEILEKSKQLFGEGDERTLRVSAAIGRRMDRVYGDASNQGSKPLPWSDLMLLLFCTGGAIFFVRNGIDGSDAWELVAAGLLAFIGAGAAMNALEYRRDTAG